MTISELISFSVAIVALLLSVIGIVFSGIQTKRATETLVMNQQLERGNAVIHFTSRFFDLVRDGEPDSELTNPQWAYQFWSLHATEFYFFHHGILPTFMYSLWMIDMAKLYSGPNGQHARQSHIQYLHTYSFNYPEMISFFNEINEMARTCNDENMKNRKVAEYVSSWINENKRNWLN